MTTTTAATKFRFAGIQLSVTADKALNHHTAKSKIIEAAKAGSSMITLPECWNCPYGNKYFPDYAETINADGSNSESISLLKELAKEYGVYIIGGSIPERDGEKLYNTSISINPKGEIIGKHRKIHLFDIDVPGKIRFMESETLSPGNSLTVLKTEFCNVGVGICYDIRFPELAQLYAQSGCKFIVYPGAFNMVTGPAHWELLIRARALDNELFVACVSPARDSGSGYIAWGHSTVVNPWGEVISTTDEKPGIIYADIDIARVDEVRGQIPTFMQKRHDLYQLQNKSQL